MDKERKLILVKALHTVIWIFYNCVTLYLLYGAIANEMDLLFWICYVLIALEGLILLAFKFTCPLTLLARRYSDSKTDNFDIYLPLWLAKYTKLIYSSIIAIATGITIYQLSK